MSGLHVAIIMDGNGRWARERDLPRWRGHVAGVESVRRVVEAAPDLGVAVLTLYAFSSDNWKRPGGEVKKIFTLMRRYLRSERRELREKGVRLSAIGRRDRIPTSALEALIETERFTARGTRLHLRLAIDYSARHQIACAVRELAATNSAPEEIAENLQQRIAEGVNDPDLLIRTAGEQRLSDFLLWESAYSELYFTDKHWPEFDGADLARAVESFARRERRFGGLPPSDPRVAV